MDQPRQHMHLRVSARERALQALGVQRRHGFIADNQRLRSLGARRKRISQQHGTTGNHNGIGTITQINMDSFGHG